MCDNGKIQNLGLCVSTVPVYIVIRPIRYMMRIYVSVGSVVHRLPVVPVHNVLCTCS